MSLGACVLGSMCPGERCPRGIHVLWVTVCVCVGGGGVCPVTDTVIMYNINSQC